MRCYFPDLVLPLMLAGACVGVAQEACSQQGSQYYPLAKGNRWTYRVRALGKAGASTVEWRVTSKKGSQEGEVYQVWPSPMESDDEAMVLLASTTGIEETTARLLILKSHIADGETWISAKTSWSAPHKFHILSAHEPCRVGPVASDDCVRVEDEDNDLHRRTVTTYAKGVGPVRYEYFRGASPGRPPVQLVELISYKLSSE